MKDVNILPWIIWDHAPFVGKIVTANKTSITTGYFYSLFDNGTVVTTWTVELTADNSKKESE